MRLPQMLSEAYDAYKDKVVFPSENLLHKTTGLLQNGIYQCPLCKKSLIDMTNNWNRIEAYMSSTQMPEQYRDQTSNILCNDCEKKNTVPFHFMYHKCLDCNSWNTTVL